VTEFRSKWRDFVPKTHRHPTDKTDKRSSAATERVMHPTDKTDKTPFVVFVGSLSDPRGEIRGATQVDPSEQADAQARAAGLVVLKPGAVYHTAPTPLHEVLVLREGAKWVAWAGLYPPPHFNGPKDRPRKTWMLYKGKDLRAALAAAVRFAERLLDRRDCGGAGGPDTRRYPPWAALVAGGAGVGAGGHSDPPGAGVSAAGAHCLRGQGCPKNS
jgi:hypothetical protein